MSFILFSLNHKKADIDVRESLALIDDIVPLFLDKIIQNESINGAVVVSTCNRTECYIDIIDNKENYIKSFLSDNWCSFANNVKYNFFDYIDVINDKLAVKHLIKVCCGIDSMILGEPQIFGQIKQAFYLSDKLGCLSSDLWTIFNLAFSTAKKIRTKTDVGKCPVSVAFSAIDLIKQKTDINRKKIMILGAGKTAKLIIRHLLANNVENITIVNRTLNNAKKLAQEFCISINIAEFSSMKTIINNSDVIITAVNSNNYLLNIKDFHDVNKNIVIVDLSVPRVIVPELSKNKFIDLYCVDDITKIIDTNIKSRKEASILAQKIISETISNMPDLKRLHSYNISIVKIRQYNEQWISRELEKTIKNINDGGVVIDNLKIFSKKISNKLLHKHSNMLKESYVSNNKDMIEFIEKLYNK